jgi:hypothetical protein
VQGDSQISTSHTVRLHSTVVYGHEGDLVSTRPSSSITTRLQVTTCTVRENGREFMRSCKSPSCPKRWKSRSDQRPERRRPTRDERNENLSLPGRWLVGRINFLFFSKNYACFSVWLGPSPPPFTVLRTG